MQSGVMEGRDKGGLEIEGREWGTEQLEPCQTLQSISCRETKTKTCYMRRALLSKGGYHLPLTPFSL